MHVTSKGLAVNVLAPAIVARIRDLLEEGRLSKRKIAIQEGLARQTVDAIAAGIHPHLLPRPATGEPPAAIPLARCKCGAISTGRPGRPCVACRLRSLGRGQATPWGDPPADFRLDLSRIPGAKRRYLALRRAKIAAERAARPPDVRLDESA